MILCRFDYQPFASRQDTGRTIARYPLSQVPDEGELINISGNPFRIIRRGWSIDEKGNLYCFLDVIKASEFKFNNDLDINPATNKPY